MEAVEYRGHWWRPENPEDRVTGTLTFKPGHRPVLLTIGDFSSRVEHGPDALIYGRTADQKKITLYRYSEPLRLPIPQEMVTTIEADYSAKFALVGKHFARPEEIAFADIEFGLTNLQDWTVGKLFDPRPDPASATTHVVRYTEMPDATATVGDMGITIGDSCRLSCERNREARLARTPYIRVQNSSPVPLEDLLNGPVLTLQNFVAFGLGFPVGTTRLQATLRDPEETKIDILVGTKEPPERESPHPNEVLFTLPQIVSHLDGALQQWFALHKRIPSVLDLYFTSLYGEPAMPQHQHFLSIAQALESYHADIYDGRFLPREVFAAAKEAFAAALPADLDAEVRHTALDKINNWPTLKQRLTYLLTQAPRTILARAIPDPGVFESVVRHTRNYYTHYGRPTEDVVRSVDLLNLTERMRWLLEGLLLGRLGLPDTTVEALLQRNVRLSNAGRWNLLP